MLSKSQIKLITSLKQKKYRLLHGFFVVEGIKTIKELLESNLELQTLYTTETFNIDAKDEILISEAELKRISFLTTPNKALAIFKIPKPKTINTNGLIVVLDAIRDPGNLGTIIRLCDWFGIKDLVCGAATVDCFNPKVIQASGWRDCRLYGRSQCCACIKWRLFCIAWIRSVFGRYGF